MSNPPLYIDQPEILQQFCQQIAGSPWLALDTEFQRERTYYPIFCLIQVTNGEHTACIDALALESLEPLFERIYDRSTIKVLHSGRQDMEIFYHLRGAIPAPLFDTQLAAPLLGYSEQIGYAALVSEMVGVTLDKAHTRTDWTQRPLTPEQLRYAADDVIYLGQIYQQILQQLESRGRLDWLEPDFQALANLHSYENHPEQAWRRIRAAKSLNGKRLSIVQAVAEWREQVAQSEDRPRGWILKDDAIIDLARLQPKNSHAMKQIRGIAERTARRHGDKLCELIGQALQRSPSRGITPSTRAVRKTVQQEAMLDALQAIVRLRAAKESLNPAVLASKKELEGLILGTSESRLEQGWRSQMVGEELHAMLNGEQSLRVVDGQLVLQPITIQRTPD